MSTTHYQAYYTDSCKWCSLRVQYTQIFTDAQWEDASQRWHLEWVVNIDRTLNFLLFRVLHAQRTSTTKERQYINNNNNYRCLLGFPLYLRFLNLFWTEEVDKSISGVWYGQLTKSPSIWGAVQKSEDDIAGWLSAPPSRRYQTGWVSVTPRSRPRRRPTWLGTVTSAARVGLTETSSVQVCCQPLFQGFHPCLGYLDCCAHDDRTKNSRFTYDIYVHPEQQPSSLASDLHQCFLSLCPLSRPTCGCRRRSCGRHRSPPPPGSTGVRRKCHRVEPSWVVCRPGRVEPLQSYEEPVDPSYPRLSSPVATEWQQSNWLSKLLPLVSLCQIGRSDLPVHELASEVRRPRRGGGQGRGRGRGRQQVDGDGGRGRSPRRGGWVRSKVYGKTRNRHLARFFPEETFSSRKLEGVRAPRSGSECVRLPFGGDQGAAAGYRWKDFLGQVDASQKCKFSLVMPCTVTQHVLFSVPDYNWSHQQEIFAPYGPPSSLGLYENWRGFHHLRGIGGYYPPPGTDGAAAAYYWNPPYPPPPPPGSSVLSRYELKETCC